ncbi:hypothetical protein HYU19_05900 [Candidatus Woesearchaeota archaeon]|nr:hypothetical protein [Candidatus Woesearchaeota archaeon]
METITVPKEEYTQMQEELKILRDNKIYKRLLEFEEHISQGKRLTRKDLGI